MDRGVGLTFGVEEEFHLLNPATGRLAPGARQLLSAFGAHDVFGLPNQEFQQAMVETATPVCHDLDELRQALIATRTTLIQAGDRVGLWIAAAGTVPDCGIVTAPVYPDERYRRISDEYRRLAVEQQVCACQVQVGVPDEDLAFHLIRRIRGWLPVLLALSGGSPYFQNQDTGYASYRAVVLSRWPTSGPMPLFADRTDYHRRVDKLITAGVIGDYGMIYYDVRPSQRYPTLEIRIADACPMLDDVLLIAALARALVVTAADEEERGEPIPDVADELLRGATWRAARSGLRGKLVDAVAGDAVASKDLVRRFIRHVRPALEASGDDAYVDEALLELAKRGTSAERQRRALSAGKGMHKVTASIVAETRTFSEK
ncbi:glutamate--cysteine ligase [Hamadaea sp. NPDC051192]|uniref:carboxylate-amine ligase n=1 Tax=Hamadaea sp. NPDC051192 TaxID=3154940 RepID=UPI003417B550